MPRRLAQRSQRYAEGGEKTICGVFAVPRCVRHLPAGRRPAAANSPRFDHRINPANANGGTADLSIVNVADGAVRPLVTQDGPDTGPVWPPDGSKIAFQSAMAKPFYYYANSIIAVVPGRRHD